jgi:hypothetical protein
MASDEASHSIKAQENVFIKERIKSYATTYTDNT